MGCCGLTDEIIVKAKSKSQSNIDKESTFCNSKVQTKSDKDYILPEKLTKRNDITKFYNISGKILGEGSSGQICIGEKDNKKYAIKRISKENIKLPSQIILEVEISLNLGHKNIINYYEVYEDLKYISCVMDLGDGGDLFDFIINCPLGHLPDDISIGILIQILEAVDYLHSSKNIIHRDLKPENFLIHINEENKPEIKLIDFGLATYIPNSTEKLTQTVGTRAYSAPEVIKKTGYREKVDEWSIGVIMFNMLTGFEPFIGKDTEELKNHILYSEVNFELIENIILRNLCKKLMERDDDKRITVKEALEEIKKIKI